MAITPPNAARPPLPPLHISKLAVNVEDALPQLEPYIQKIKYIIDKAFLITGEIYTSFKELKSLKIGSYRIDSYSAIMRNRDPILQTFGIEEESDDEDLQGQGQHEFLIFLNRSSPPSDDVFVLATSKAHRIISNYCSQQFPKQISSFLSEHLIKIEKIISGKWLGPVAQSDLHLRDDLPLQVEQSNSICREFTGIFRPFIACIEGEEVRIRFKEKSILVYRDLTLESYVQITDIFSEKNLYVERWGLPGLPEFTKVITIQAKRNEELLLFHLLDVQEEDTKYWKFDLTVSETAFSGADEYRFRYSTKKNNITESFFWKFDFPFSCPTIETVQAFLNYYRQKWSIDFDGTHKANVRYVFDHKLPSIEYKVKGVWMRKYVLDCTEGRIEHASQDIVYFKMGETWYWVQRTYLEKVNANFVKTVETSILRHGQPGFLERPWNTKEVGEVEYNKSYPLHCNNSLNKLWFDGNSKLLLKCEIFDILCATTDRTFIYHVKKVFGKDIRDAVTQLVLSAQIIRGYLDQGQNYNLTSRLLEFCERVGGNNSRELLQAFKTKELNFVLAFPLAGDPLQTMLNSQSLNAKREIIRAKEEIEKLGFIFKISPIPISP